RAGADVSRIVLQGDVLGGLGLPRLVGQGLVADLRPVRELPVDPGALSARGQRLVDAKRDPEPTPAGEARSGPTPGRVLPRGLRHPRLAAVSGEATHV